ncbi:MAG: DUF1194 domain-containing protein [Sedimentitalea sp.]
MIRAALLIVLTLATPLRADTGIIEVDMQLVLAVDVSFSISGDEQDIQRKGYIAAFRDPEIISAITGGARGRISVTYLEWAGTDMQAQVVPWTLISDPLSARAFADRLDQTPIKRSGRTSISKALSTALGLFRDSPFVANRMVVDISSDGLNNDGRRVDRIRDMLVYHGITINGLPLMIRPASGPEADLDRYFQDCVVGGLGAFVAPVGNWDAFAPTLKQKLIAEIATPMPRARLLRANSTLTDCLSGEKEDLRKYIEQLEDATGNNADRWRPREEDWPMPD